MIMIIKLILICLSNLFFNFFIKMKNKKRTVSRFPFSYENEKRMKVLKIQRKNLLNMKMVVSYLNFVFFIEVKTKSRYRILNFVFQFTKNTKWHFGYTDFCQLTEVLTTEVLKISKTHTFLSFLSFSRGFIQIHFGLFDFFVFVLSKKYYLSKLMLLDFCCQKISFLCKHSFCIDEEHTL